MSNGKGSRQRKRLVKSSIYHATYDELYRKDCDICEGQGEVDIKLLGPIVCPKCDGEGLVAKSSSETDGYQ